ncbi:SAF domain-containing protein [Microbacterium sp. X-17]|uniref:SAF domain-containing protein n=1 Tax=Microbacterium sp. X-17 TaxID=3144404 RepID=UPI0031F47FA2
MTALPTSARRARPLWADVRFLLGIVLILVSVSGVWLVVAAARQTTPVLVASRTLVPGHEVAAGDLRIVDVALGAASSAYLSAAATATGRVATRTVVAGELVPADALADAAETEVTRVVVRSAADVPASVVGGTTVEVWAAPPAEGTAVAAPRILVADAVVAAVSEETGMIRGGTTAIELVIPRAAAPDVLEAVATGSSMSVLPVAGGSR